jgi:hypothetical protein
MSKSNTSPAPTLTEQPTTVGNYPHLYPLFEKLLQYCELQHIVYAMEETRDQFVQYVLEHESPSEEAQRICCTMTQTYRIFREMSLLEATHQPSANS